MIKIRLFLVFIVFVNTYAHARIFGSDDRFEIYQHPLIENAVSDSVAIMVSPVFLKQQSGSFGMDFNLISDSFEIALCPSERFYGQPTASVNCTGFLVAPDLLLTAGHCITHVNSEIRNQVTPQCKDFVWIFDYKYKSNLKIDHFFPNENVYRCSEVIYAKFLYTPQGQGSTEPHYGDDIALIKLERETKRKSLTLSSTIAINQKVFTVGYPSGLPQKISLNGRVKSIKPMNYFTSTLDVFGGNSGGPVFNDKNQVLGLVVRSFPSKDYTYLKNRQCSVPDRCAQSLKNCEIPKEQKMEDEFTHAQKINDFILNLIR